MKLVIGRRLPDSPPPQQGASDPISGLTGLCVYLFYLHIFPFQINIISLKFWPVSPLKLYKRYEKEEEIVPFKNSRTALQKIKN